MKPITAFVVRAIRLCTRYAWWVIAGAIVLTILCSWYAATHFLLTTDINQLISTNSVWRQRELAFEKAFPQYQTIIAVIDAPTAEFADEATAALVGRLSQQKDLFRSIEEPQGGSFFAQHGLLFEPAEQLAPQMKMLTQAERLLQNLASDPSLGGVIRGLQFGLIGVQGGQMTLDQMTWAMTLAANTLDQVNANRPASFSWHALAQGRVPKPNDLRRFLRVRAVLDFTALEPGLKASDAIRHAADELNFASAYQARVRLTGPVAMPTKSSPPSRKTRRSTPPSPLPWCCSFSGWRCAGSASSSPCLCAWLSGFRSPRRPA